MQKKDYGIIEYKQQYNITSDNVGRVVRRDGMYFQVVTLDEEIIRATANDNVMDSIAVGDFVEYVQIEEHFFVTRLYPRRTLISKASNRTAKSFHTVFEEQVLATNVDRVFIVMAADQRFSIAKLERYLFTFSDELVNIHLIISKSDVTNKRDSIAHEIMMYYPELPVYYVSIYDEQSIDSIRGLIGTQETVIFLGSSGAGKSTLINALNHNSNELVGETRRDGKGKHTTTYTTLVPLQGTSSYLVDTPGFKGIEAAKEVDVAVLFDDILSLAQQCKFSDCQHNTEHGCAVKEAIENGTLSREKYERFLVNNKKLQGLKKYEQQKQRKKEKKIRRSRGQ